MICSIRLCVAGRPLQYAATALMAYKLKLHRLQPRLPESGVVCHRQHRQLTQQCSTSRQTRWDLPQNFWGECAWRVPWPLWQVASHTPVQSFHCGSPSHGLTAWRIM